MIWTWEPHVSEPLLALNPNESEILARILRRDLSRLLNKHEKYKDIHESGEATDRQENKLVELEEEVKVIQRFIKKVETDK